MSSHPAGRGTGEAVTAKSDRSWSLTEALGAFTLPCSTDCLRQKKQTSGHEGCLSGAD